MQFALQFIAPRAMRVLILSTGLTVIGAGSSALANESIAGVTIHKGISETVAAWNSAVEAGDVTAIAKLHGTNTVLYGVTSMSTVGDQAIVAGFADMFKKYNAKVEMKDAYWVQEGSLLSSWGMAVLTLTPKAGTDKPIRVENRFSDIAVKVNGQWQYIMDHASVPAK